MGDHIVRRGAAASSTRRSEPRPTAELTKQELHGLIREHDREHDHAALEPDLEIGGDAPRALPNASSPRMFAHTLRRAPSPEASATARGSTGPRPPLVERTDISTIEMPRVERAAPDDDDPFGDAISDDELTRLRQRFQDPNAFDEPIPPAEDDFEADCVDLPFAVPPYEPRTHAVAEDMPRVDPALAHAVPGAPPPDAVRGRIPVRRVLRVAAITLTLLIAAAAGYLLTHSIS